MYWYYSISGNCACILNGQDVNMWGKCTKISTLCVRHQLLYLPVLVMFPSSIAFYNKQTKNLTSRMTNASSNSNIQYLWGAFHPQSTLPTLGSLMQQLSIPSLIIIWGERNMSWMNCAFVTILELQINTLHCYEAPLPLSDLFNVLFLRKQLQTIQ